MSAERIETRPMYDLAVDETTDQRQLVTWLDQIPEGSRWDHVFGIDGVIGKSCVHVSDGRYVRVVAGRMRDEDGVWRPNLRIDVVDAQFKVIHGGLAAWADGTGFDLIAVAVARLLEAKP